MKLRKHTLAAVFLLLGANAVLAQPPGGGLMRMDQDGDGRISQEEFTPPAERRGRGLFARFDEDDDGAVTRDELERSFSEQAERMQGKVLSQFEAMDADGNGVVSSDEAAAHAFSRLDADGDGFVTGEEAAAMHDLRRDRHPKSRRDGGYRSEAGSGESAIR
jgi:Ca2+-binding EF-hand superfamily protein